jgi:hypothetical protein
MRIPKDRAVALVGIPGRIRTFLPIPKDALTDQKNPREHCIECESPIPPGKPGRVCKPCREDKL